MNADLRIGTSGWHYKHWLGDFYPEELPAARMLDYYLRHFSTVELNTTFYRLPTEAGVEGWRTAAPAGFVFAAKGSRFITHMKKLKDPDPALARYFDRIDRLGGALGPVVWQLPPNWDVDLARLELFLAALPPGRRFAFEFRNHSWHSEAVWGLLRRYNAAWCSYDLAGFQSPIELTADFTYVRLHGPAGAYQGSYPEETLDRLAGRIESWRRGLKAVYVYFDNDVGGFAVHNALALQQRL